METQLELAGGAGPFARGARYNGYGAFLRERFGCRVYKVIVDAGFTCPNRDGTVAIGGCTYCNNDSFRPQAERSRCCRDRKSTRLNSSHTVISYAVFCLKKKKQQTTRERRTISADA